jgi:hypothetical protein
LLAPFNFNDVFIPQIYAIPIEVAAILLVYFGTALTAKVPFRITVGEYVFLTHFQILVIPIPLTAQIRTMQATAMEIADRL